MNKTSIEWCFGGYTWNPTRGCSRAGVDCEGCYAERLAGRFVGSAFKGFVRTTKKGARWTGKLALLEDKLDEPLRLKREIGAPAPVIFVDSMSDLFHESLPDAAIDAVVARMYLVNHARHVSLTKRTDRQLRYFQGPHLWERLEEQAHEVRRRYPMYNQIGIQDPAKGLPSHIWWGMSAGNQATFNERFAAFKFLPSRTKVLSIEPLIGPIDLRKPWHQTLGDWGVRWVIVGAESGPTRRPADPQWARDIRDACVEERATFFLKQWARDDNWAGLAASPGMPAVTSSHAVDGPILSLPFLDGVQYKTMPQVHSTGDP